MSIQHLKETTLKKQINQNDFLMQLFMGGGDGLILVFFAATTLAKVQADNTTLITICTIIIFLSGIIMGLSGYLASLIEKNHFKTVLKKEVQLEDIRKETQLLDYLKINKSLQKIAFEEMEKDRQHWAGLMGGIENSLSEKAGYSFANGWKTGLSYVIGGILPLLPYFFVDNEIALIFSIIISALALCIFGYFKSFYKQTNPILSVLNALLAAFFAGAGAYAIGKIFVYIGIVRPLYF